MGAPPGGIIDSRYLELGIDHALGEGDLFFSRRAATKKAQAQILKPKDVVHSHCGGDEVGNGYWDGNENGNGNGSSTADGRYREQYQFARDKKLSIFLHFQS